MKIAKYLFPLLLVILFAACKKQAISPSTDEVPPCLNSKLVEMRHWGACEKGAHLDLYTLHGKRLFLYGHGGCISDAGDVLIDTNCNDIGYVGGWSSQTNIYDGDFKDAVFVKNLWKN